jgi:ATP-dependent Lhr-like helicase
MSSTDPANVYSLALEGVERDAFTRPRGSGAFLVTVGGRVILSVEGRGRRMMTRPETDPAELRSAVAGLVTHLTAARGSGRAHDIVVETINGEPATSSPWLPSFLDAAFRREGRSLRFYATIR